MQEFEREFEMSLNAIHMAFRRAAARAFLKTASDPTAPNHELNGSYSALREELRSEKKSYLTTLRRMTKPKTEGGLDRLVVSADSWSLTVSGLNEYGALLDEARAHLGFARKPG